LGIAILSVKIWFLIAYRKKMKKIKEGQFSWSLFPGSGKQIAIKAGSKATRTQRKSIGTA
jgi:hypothetical protein